MNIHHIHASAAAFLIVVATVFAFTEQKALADVPVRAQCSAGEMVLTYGDDSRADAYVGVVAPIPVDAPRAPGVDPRLENAIVDFGEENGFERRRGGGRGNEQEQIVLQSTEQSFASLLVQRAHAQDDPDFGGGGGGVNFTGNPYTAAGLAELVKQEGGGGPFCFRQEGGIIYEALSDQNCGARFPGTQFAGFKIEVVYPTYACGVPAPWTDG
jgi:hypothetical protein